MRPQESFIYCLGLMTLDDKAAFSRDFLLMALHNMLLHAITQN